MKCTAFVSDFQYCFCSCFLSFPAVTIHKLTSNSCPSCFGACVHALGYLLHPDGAVLCPGRRGDHGPGDYRRGAHGYGFGVAVPSHPVAVRGNYHDAYAGCRAGPGALGIGGLFVPGSESESSNGSALRAAYHALRFPRASAGAVAFAAAAAIAAGAVVALFAEHR